jgi:uncharacterized protein YecE (DUF72 family)
MSLVEDLVRIGTSGFSYRHWKGRFYPPDLKQSEWLEYYAGLFDTVELNVTFYRMPREEVFRSWRNRTPEGFAFALKGARMVTHLCRLKDCEESLRLFLKQVALLGDKLGPLLWQLPPFLRRDDTLLARFLHDLTAAPTKGLSLRHAFEFRHSSWFAPPVYELLRAHGAALCCAHSGVWPTELEATCPWVYARFHGGKELYGSCYSNKELSEWAGRLRLLVESKLPVFAYFNNDAHAHAVANALRLRSLLGRAGSGWRSEGGAAAHAR